VFESLDLYFAFFLQYALENRIGLYNVRVYGRLHLTLNCN